ncbi:MAG: hypothetical protein JRI65_14265 [Deltaproteobacteria bacterium]|nr:hypothetical protein [Deltaproteobacteria bacterium]
MSDRRWFITTILCILASFLGSMFSSQLFQANNAFANKSKNSKIIEANEFRVIDAKGVVKASFGMRESYSNKFIPSLRILTKAYGSDSGILIESSEYSSIVNMYGENAQISMDVSSLPSGEGTSSIKVESRPNLDIFSEKSKERDSSRVEIKSGVGFPTRIEFFDKDNNHRAILGHVTLEEKDTGVTKEYPTSLVFFDKKGLTIWKAP